MVKDIELNYYGFGDFGLWVISMVLKGCLNVIILNFYDNGIGDKGMIYIVRMLKRNFFISKVDLLGNYIGL